MEIEPTTPTESLSQELDKVLVLAAMRGETIRIPLIASDRLSGVVRVQDRNIMVALPRQTGGIFYGRDLSSGREWRVTAQFMGYGICEPLMFQAVQTFVRIVRPKLHRNIPEFIGRHY